MRPYVGALRRLFTALGAYRLALLAAQWEQRPEETARLFLALADRQTDKDAALSFGLRGLTALIRTGHLEEAARRLQAFRARYPDSLDLQRTEAAFYEAAQAPGRAVEIWQHLAQTTHAASDHLSYIRVLALAGKTTEALDGLNKLTGPDTAARQKVRAFLQEHEDDLTAALATWQSLIEQHPEDHTNWYALARVFTETGQYAAATQTLATLARARPQDIEPLNQLVQSHKRSQHWARALRTARLIHRRFPRHAAGQAHSVRCLLELGRYDQAEQMAADLLRRFPNDILARETWAWSAFGSGRWQDAEQRWLHVAALAPHRWHPLLYIGQSRLRAQSVTPDELLSFYQEAAARFPHTPPVLVKAAQILETCGRPADALDTWRHIQSLAPSHPLAANAIGRLLILGGKTEEASRVLERLARSSTGALFPWSAKAVLSASQGDLTTARAHWTQAVQRLRDKTDAYLARSRDSGFTHTLHGSAEVHLDSASHRRNAARFAATVDHLRQTTPTVCVVGNAPSLLGQGLGAAIDAHDLVVRINDFRLDGFQSDTGARTDHQFLSIGVQHRDRPIADDCETVFISASPNHHFGHRHHHLRRILGITSNRPIFLPHPVMELLNDITYLSPSAGLRAMMFYRGVLGLPVSIAGFDFFITSRDHYYEAPGANRWISETHCGRYERLIAHDLLHALGEVKSLTTP